MTLSGSLWPYPAEILCAVAAHLPMHDLRAAAETNSLFRSMMGYELVIRTPATLKERDGGLALVQPEALWGKECGAATLARVLDIRTHEQVDSPACSCDTPLPAAWFPKLEAIRVWCALTPRGAWNAPVYNETHRLAENEVERGSFSITEQTVCQLAAELMPHTVVLRGLSLYSSGFRDALPIALAPPQRMVWVFETSDQGLGAQRMNPSAESYIRAARGVRELIIVFHQHKGLGWVTETTDSDCRSDYAFDADRVWDMVVAGVGSLFAAVLPYLLSHGSEAGAIPHITVVNTAPLEYSTAPLVGLGRISSDGKGDSVRRQILETLTHSLTSSNWTDSGVDLPPPSPRHTAAQLARHVAFLSMEEYLATRQWPAVFGEKEVEPWRSEP